MVRVRYSFGSRHTGRIGNIKKQRGKYPEIMKEVINISDIVLEVLDSRFIEETRNIEIEERVDSLGKVLVFVFNKCDLVDKEELESQIPSWMRPYVFCSATKGIGLKDLVGRVKMEAKRIVAERKALGGDADDEKFLDKGKKKGEHRAKTRREEKTAVVRRDEGWDRVHVGVIGVPNAGKSSVINFMTRRAAAKTGAKAGFTKGMQKIRLSDGILVLDTPGVIPESRYTTEKKGEMFEDVKVGARSYSDVRDPERAVLFLVRGKDVAGRRSQVAGRGELEVEELKEKQRFLDEEALKNAVAIEKFYDVRFIESDGANVEALIEGLGKKKGFLGKGGVVDEDRTARLILRDWQEGKIKV